MIRDHPLSSLRDVVAGFVAGTHFWQQQRSEARGPRYSLCLLFEGADPLILSTMSDAERSDICTALANAQAGSLSPTPGLLHSGLLLRELPDAATPPEACLAMLTSGARLVLFVHDGPLPPSPDDRSADRQDAWHADAPPGQAFAALVVTGHATRVLSDPPRLVVPHSTGQAVFVADAAAADAWANAISDGAVRVEQVESLIASAFGPLACGSDASYPAHYGPSIGNDGLPQPPRPHEPSHMRTEPCCSGDRSVAACEPSDSRCADDGAISLRCAPTVRIGSHGRLTQEVLVSAVEARVRSTPA